MEYYSLTVLTKNIQKIFCISILLVAFQITLHAQTTDYFFQDSFILITSIDVHYESDKFLLATQDSIDIETFISDQDISSLFFDIKAYTDSDGSDSYNEKLSERRSSAIKNHLLTNGVDSSQIITHAYGESQIVTIEKTENEKEKNRKSVITVFQRLDYVMFSGRLDGPDSVVVKDVKVKIIDEGVKREYVLGDSREFSVPIPIDRKIELQVLAKNHFPFIKRMKLNKNSNPKNVPVVIKEMRIDSVLTLTINFVGDKSIIRKFSHYELDALTETLTENGQVCVELMGHINRPNRPKTETNSTEHHLSIARATEIKRKLVENGVAEERLLARGYGNHHMLFPYAQQETLMSLNRRVEVKVMSCDSAKVLEDHILGENLLARFRR